MLSPASLAPSFIEDADAALSGKRGYTPITAGGFNDASFASNELYPAQVMTSLSLQPCFFNSFTYANANNFCVQKVDAAVRTR